VPNLAVARCEAYLAGCRHDGAFAWIGLSEPTEAKFETVRSAFGLITCNEPALIHHHEQVRLALATRTARFGG
jgi:hypothetical protein